MDNYEKRRLEEIRKAHQQRKKGMGNAKSSQNKLIIVSVLLIGGLAWLGKSMFSSKDVLPDFPQPERQWTAPEPITLSKEVAAKKILEEKIRKNRATTEKNFYIESEPATPEFVAQSKQEIIEESDEEIDFFRQRLQEDDVKNDTDLKSRTEAHLKRALKQREYYEKIDPNDEGTWDYFDK